MMDTDTLDKLNAKLETVTVENHEGGFSELRLDRSRRMNALNEQMVKDLLIAVDTIKINPPDALVVTGSGSRAFSIGLDPSIFEKIFQGETEGIHFRQIIGSSIPTIMDGLDRMDTPVVCAVQGPAYGGGLEVALATDIRIAGDSTEVALPEINHGFLPAGGATQRLPSLIGEARAKEIIFTDNIYDAETLADWGLFSRVVSDDDVENEAFELAEDLATRPRNSYAGVKHAIRIHNNRERTGFDAEFMYAEKQVEDVEFSEIK
jgi:enoyl-CoA hydratase/3-hydroxyacyl-CoA dehydrogenase